MSETYTKDFKMEDIKTMETPMVSSIKLAKDGQGISIEPTMYMHDRFFTLLNI